MSLSVEFGNLFDTKLAKIDALFMTKMAEVENYTNWGRTYLYRSSKGVASQKFQIRLGISMFVLSFT